MSSKLQILCAFLAANYSILVLFNSIWLVKLMVIYHHQSFRRYSLPNTDPFHSGSTLSRIIGMVGTKSNNFLVNYFSIRLAVLFGLYHMLISINRFIAIVFPFKRKRIVNAKTTTAAVWLIILVTILQCSPFVLGLIL